MPASQRFVTVQAPPGARAAQGDLSYVPLRPFDALYRVDTCEPDNIGDHDEPAVLGRRDLDLRQANTEGDTNTRPDSSEAQQCFDSLRPSSDDLDWTVHSHFLESDFLRSCPLPSPFSDAESESGIAYEVEPSNVSAIYADATDVLNEKWNVTKATAEYLAREVLLVAKTTHDVATSNSHSQIRSMKLEEPVLLIDHELQLLDVKARNMPKPSHIGSTMFALDDEEDESLCWPPRTWALAATADSIVRTEKLTIDKDAAFLLQDVMCLGSEEADDDVSRLASKFTTSKKRMSPPVLPFSPPSTQAFVPDAMLDFTSTPEDPDIAHLTNLEYDLMHEDLPSLDNTVQQRSDNSCNGLGVLSSSSCNVSPHHRRVRDFKIDTPPLPLTLSSDTHPEESAKRRALNLGGYLNRPYAATCSSLTCTQKADDELNQLLEDIVMLGGTAAVEQLRNEQLSRADTLMRVQIPDIEDVSPTPPWESFLLDTAGHTKLTAQLTCLKYVKRELLQSEQKWRGASRLERSLPWSPFPYRLATVEIHEALDDVSVGDYLDTVSLKDENLNDSLWPAFTLKSMLREWNSAVEHVQHFDHVAAIEEDAKAVETHGSNSTGDDRMIVDARFETAPAMPTGDPQTLPVHRTMALEALLHLKRAKIDESMHSRASAVLAFNDQSKSYPQASATTSDLSGFMHRLGNHVHNKATTTQRPLTHVEYAVGPASKVSLHFDESNGKKQQQVSLDQLVPRLDANFTKAFSVIMSTLICADRAFAKSLQSLLPNTLFIEREAPTSGFESSSSIDVGTNVRKTAVDMIIAPGTGIIVTSLQQLKQKPLPGHSATFGVRERIAVGIRSVQRLLVMVRDTSRSADHGTLSLDQRDCNALTDLMSTAATLDADIQVLLVPGEADALARWIASAIVYYSIGHDNGGLLQEETTWERLLCAAGIDAYAAQAILKSFKRPMAMPNYSDVSDESNQGTATSGLPALVSMTGKQRIKRFSPLLGGTEVLSRFNEAIDMVWSPSHSL